LAVRTLNRTVVRLILEHELLTIGSAIAVPIQAKYARVGAIGCSPSYALYKMYRTRSRLAITVFNNFLAYRELGASLLSNGLEIIQRSVKLTVLKLQDS
jgi:hypothetical protein